MAGFTDVAFRKICKNFGADVVVSEFVQSDALNRENARTWREIDFSPAQRPMGIQIFGGNPDSMARAAKLLRERLAPDFIDLNFGCPAPKVVQTNAGSSLLKDLKTLGNVAKNVVEAVPDVPVTAKIRLGWSAKNLVHVEAAKILEDAGIRVLAVHGRTKIQNYTGAADWEKIAEVVQSVKIPVVGNGDISSGEIALRRVRESGVSGLMIGRGALGKPWIFSEIKALFRGENFVPPSVPEIAKIVLSYAEEICSTRVPAWNSLPQSARERENIRWCVSRLHGFTSGFPGGKKLRAEISKCGPLGDFRAVFSIFL